MCPSSSDSLPAAESESRRRGGGEGGGVRGVREGYEEGGGQQDSTCLVGLGVGG